MPAVCLSSGCSGESGSGSASVGSVSDVQGQRWEGRTDKHLIVAAVMLLASCAWPILNPDLALGPRACAPSLGEGSGLCSPSTSLFWPANT